MRSTIRKIMILIITSAPIPGKLFAQGAINDKPLTNKDVQTMVSSGVTPAIIKAAIARSRTSFDLSPAAMIELKKERVPDDIMLEMIGKLPASAAAAPKDTLESMPPGIYNRTVKGYRPVEPHQLLSPISKGAAGMLKRTFATLMNLTIKAEMPGIEAALKTEDSKPVFVFILDYPAKNPEAFFLVKLTRTPQNRQFCFQKTAVAGAAISVNDSVKVAFDFQKIHEGIFVLTPVHPLEPGQYGFIYNAASCYKGNVFKAFDFSVTPAAAPNR